MVVVWSTIAAVISTLVVLRVSDSGMWPPLLVGAGVALAVTVVAEPLLAVAVPRRPCRPAPRRRQPRPVRPPARASRVVRRTRP
ncbi:hypothetical protein ACFPM7_08910 [Actinokineospora guangxiensis]|uniref:MMPL family protein n=1 Tax=Actinokineospora guangxiensis TaxID=1490288 RepID=A0ABW0EML7_9PSEU